MQKPEVYQYRQVRAFLVDCFAFRKAQETSFSLRTWAKEMGLPSHTLLVMLLKGRRPFRVQHASWLGTGLGLTSHERLYLQALIQWENAESPEEKELCRLWLADLHPGKEFRSRELDQFQAISHWVHSALFALADVSSWDGTPESAHAALGLLKDQVTRDQVEQALNRLLELGLLQRNPETGHLEQTLEHWSTRDDYANEGARRYHKDISALAALAVERVPISEREFQSLSLSVPNKNIPLAKELIRKFRVQFLSQVGEGAGDDVYQLNLQFFRLTEASSLRLANGARTEAPLPPPEKQEMIC